MASHGGIQPHVSVLLALIVMPTGRRRSLPRPGGRGPGRGSDAAASVHRGSRYGDCPANRASGASS